MLEKVNQLNLMFDFYGELLTKRQQEVFKLYYHQDLSLREIAEANDISRAAVHDLLKRVEKQLFDYENKLRLVSRFSLINEKLDKLTSFLNLLQGGASQEEIEKLKEIVTEISTIERQGP